MATICVLVLMQCDNNSVMIKMSLHAIVRYMQAQIVHEVFPTAYGCGTETSKCTNIHCVANDFYFDWLAVEILISDLAPYDYEELSVLDGNFVKNINLFLFFWNKWVFV